MKPKIFKLGTTWILLIPGQIPYRVTSWKLAMHHLYQHLRPFPL